MSISPHFQNPVFVLSLTITCLLYTSVGLSLPAPNQVFREYSWTLDNQGKDDGFLRVGGNYSYHQDEALIDSKFHVNGHIPFFHAIDLDQAVKAELVIEKLLSHEGTTGLTVQFNGHEKHRVPEAAHIPRPQTERPHFYNAIVDLPLSNLLADAQNTFKFEVNSEHPWDWPQHLIYGLTLRIYYDSTKPHSKGKLTPILNNMITPITKLKVETNDNVRRVDYFVKASDINWAGNGLRYQWQHLYFKGELQNHIGQTTSSPHALDWNTEWLPEQSKKMAIVAKITAANGVAYMTPIIDNLALKRNYKVEMSWLENPPKYWTTRNAEEIAQFVINGEPEKIEQARMYWASWSACYSHGIELNGYLTYSGLDEPCYEFAQHDIAIDSAALLQGANTLRTLKTPLYKGQMVHGMEVLYPGMMFKVKYKQSDTEEVSKTYSGNPLFEGWYADPEIAIFDKKYWIFPTYSNEFRKQLHMDAFSSTDLSNWQKHENVINNDIISWAKQAMWAPAIIERDGRYFLFFAANDPQTPERKWWDPNDDINHFGGIGIAVADQPQGPYKDYLGKPLLSDFYNGAQPIDQFIFKDIDDTHYIFYGGWGHCNLGRLNDDFTGFVPWEDGELFKEITPEGYVEGSVVFIRNGKYYFMWSEGDWADNTYQVAYAISESIQGPFKRIGVVMSSQEPIATGAGHHSVLNIPNTDEYYFVYHRRPIPNESPHHRVVAIDKMTFDASGRILPVIMTNKGVATRDLGTYLHPTK